MTAWASAFPPPGKSLEKRHLQSLSKRAPSPCKTFQNSFAPPGSSLIHRCTRKERRAWAVPTSFLQPGLFWCEFVHFDFTDSSLLSVLIIMPPGVSSVFRTNSEFPHTPKPWMPGDKSVQMPPKPFPRYLNFPMLPGKVSASERKAVGYAITWLCHQAPQSEGSWPSLGMRASNIAGFLAARACALPLASMYLQT